MSRETLPGGADHDLVDVDMGRQGEQPLNAIGYVLRFEQLAELGNRAAEVILVITGDVLEFTDHDARHDQGNADTVGADLAAKPFGASWPVCSRHQSLPPSSAGAWMCVFEPD